MHHRSPEKGSNRIDGNRWKRRASQGSNRDCRIEKPCLKRFGIKAAHLTDHLGDRIGGGACENRHGQKTSADDPQSEKRKGKLARYGTQGLGRLCRSFDVRNAVRVKGCGCREHDRGPTKMEARRVGKECVSTFGARWSPAP